MRKITMKMVTSVALFVGLTASLTYGATTDANVNAIEADGWQATYTSPSTFDPAGDPKYVVVERNGYDASAQPVKITDELLITSRVRLPYPDQATWTASNVVLSDFVYADDVVTGVTNNSALEYPLPMGSWMHYDREVVTGGTFTARLAVAHAYARNGKPVAAVKLIASDGTNADVEVLVSDMSVVEYEVTGFSVPHFSAELDLSTLDEGMVTIDAVIYPWVGEAYTLSVDGFPYPSHNLSVIKVLNNKGGYGHIYAYVDPAAGNDGTGAVSATEAIAEAAPYQTIAAAVSAAQSANSSQFGRDNTSGIIVKMEPGTYNGFGSNTNPKEGDVPMVLCAADPAQRATTILQSDDNVSNKLQTDMVISDLTLQCLGNDRLLYGFNTNQLVLKNCVFARDTAATTNPLYYWDEIYFIECEGKGLEVSPMNGGHVRLILGSDIRCSANPKQTYYNRVLGSRLVNFHAVELLAASSSRKPEGRLIGWSHFTHTVQGFACLSVGDRLGVNENGLALVGCVLERSGGGSSNMLGLAMGGETTAKNMVVQLTTTVGSKNNLCYTDQISVDTYKHVYLQHSVFHTMNHKHDVYGHNDFTGNWATRYRVGSRANAYIYGDNGDSQAGHGGWISEIWELGAAHGNVSTPINMDWTENRSTSSDTGGGDYHPGDATVIPFVPAGLAPYPVDMTGIAINNSGSAVAGALQKYPGLGTSYDISASAGAGGSISPEGAVAVTGATNQRFVFTPDSGYTVSDVVVDGASVGAVNEYTFTAVDSMHTISVAFTALPTYLIVASANTGGIIAPAGSTLVTAGDNQEYLITVISGYEIDDVLVDGVSVGNGSTYTFTAVDTAHTIEAQFAQISGIFTRPAASLPAGIAVTMDGTVLTVGWDAGNSVRATLYGTDGTRAAPPVRSGEREISFHTAHAASGLYLLQVEHDGAVHPVKVTLLK